MYLAIEPADLGVWCFDSGILQGDVFFNQYFIKQQELISNVSYPF